MCVYIYIYIYVYEHSTDFPTISDSGLSDYFRKANILIVRPVSESPIWKNGPSPWEI